jgi:hypothetical protein
MRDIILYVACLVLPYLSHYIVNGTEHKMRFWLPLFKKNSARHYKCIYVFMLSISYYTQCRSWLRHCTTNGKVAGSIPVVEQSKAKVCGRSFAVIAG